MNSGTYPKHTRIANFSPASTVLLLIGLEMGMPDEEVLLPLEGYYAGSIKTPEYADMTPEEILSRSILNAEYYRFQAVPNVNPNCRSHLR
jgi:hypothetical protein